MHMKVFFLFLTFLRFLTKYSMKLRIFGRNSADENYHRSLLIARRNVVLLLSKISITLLLSTPVICHHHVVCTSFIRFPLAGSGTNHENFTKR